MVGTKRMVGSGCLLVILVVGGFMMLMRSCLSEYDERSAHLPSIVYSNDSNALIFSIVGYDETTSYSSGAGFTRKTVNTTYSIQTNDINTAKKIRSKEIVDHSDIKEWPVRIIGNSKAAAWLFAGELMAFNPITLEKLADIKMLGKINPSLAGKFPKESKFYEFKPEEQAVFFTATNGTKWKLDANTLKVSPQSETGSDDPYQLAYDSIEKLQDQNRRSRDSVFRRFGQAGSDLRDRKITMETYHAIQKKQMEKRDELDKEAALLSGQLTRLVKRRSVEAQTKSEKSSISRLNPGYSQMGTSIDTTERKWIAMLAEHEFRDLSNHVHVRRETDETARRFLMTGEVIYDKNGQPSIDKTSIIHHPGQKYLDGGLLRDKETAKPFRLASGRRLVIHKDMIGSDGKILLSAIDKEGKLLWTSETGLKAWLDWRLFQNRLIVFGQNNKELMSDECNMLLIINLNNGAVKSYDFFTDRD